jgi:hypothetical protein
MLRAKFSSFVAFGEKVDLDEEWDFDVPFDPPSRLRVMAYLALDKTTGKYQVLVDECHIGDRNSFEFRGSKYQLFTHLYAFNVLPGQKNLDDTTVEVWLIVPMPKENKEDAPRHPNKRSTRAQG